MSEPYLGQIQPMGFGFAPKGWAQCNGQLLSIQQNTALFSLIGTYYGGNGVQTFGLPDLRGRVPVGMGSNYVIGQLSGTENVTLLSAQLPQHNHTLQANNSKGNDNTPLQGTILGNVNNVDGGTPDPFFVTGNPQALTINPNSITVAGNNQPHSNIQPYLAVNWCISMVGIYPSRN